METQSTRAIVYPATGKKAKETALYLNPFSPNREISHSVHARFVQRQTEPYDFTTGNNLKGGNSNRELYLRFTVGMVGTPMPSYATELTCKERWRVVHYVKSLVRGASE